MEWNGVRNMESGIQYGNQKRLPISVHIIFYFYFYSCLDREQYFKPNVSANDLTLYRRAVSVCRQGAEKNGR